MSFVTRTPWFSAITVYLLVLQLAVMPTFAQDQPVPAKLNIVIVEGDGAINSVRQRVAREPVVQVEDENHKPVAGAAITFLLPNQGAGATFANGARSLTVLTDDKGQAVARGLKPNGVNGQYQVRVNASFRGQTTSTTITQTNSLVAGAAVAGGISAKLLIILAVAGAAVAGGVVAATNGGGGGGGNTGAATPPTVLTPGTPTVGAPR